MSNLNPYLIDLEEFHAWLLAQPLATIVGTSCDDGDCPLARFLNAQYAGSSFLVHTLDYERVMDDISLGVEPAAERFTLPTWAQYYVELTDLSTRNVESPVNRYYAYTYLLAVCYACNISLGGQVVTYEKRGYYHGC